MLHFSYATWPSKALFRYENNIPDCWFSSSCILMISGDIVVENCNLFDFFLSICEIFNLVSLRIFIEVSDFINDFFSF